MNLQSIVVVILRLTALSFILKMLLVIMPVLMWNPKLLSGDFKLIFSRMWTFFPWFLVFIGAAVFLWILALPLARLITRRIPMDFSPVNLVLADCYTLAFVVLGLFCIVDNLPEVINSAYHLIVVVSDFGSCWRGRIAFNQILYAFTPFIVGIVLFIKSRSLAVALAKRQEKDEGAGRNG